MRLRTGAALLVVLAAATGCGVSSDAHPAQGVPYTYQWKALPAADVATTGCVAADWRCMSGFARQFGGGVLGPAKDSGTTVSGVDFPRRTAGSTDWSFWFRMSRPGGGETASLTELTEPWGDLAAEAARGGGQMVQVAGTAGAFYDHDHSQNLAWNEDGLGLQLSIRKSPGSPPPTRAELIALADSLVPYKA